MLRICCGYVGAIVRFLSLAEVFVARDVVNLIFLDGPVRKGKFL